MQKDEQLLTKQKNLKTVFSRREKSDYETVTEHF